MPLTNPLWKPIISRKYKGTQRHNLNFIYLNMSLRLIHTKTGYSTQRTGIYLSLTVLSSSTVTNTRSHSAENSHSCTAGRSYPHFFAFVYSVFYELNLNSYLINSPRIA